MQSSHSYDDLEAWAEEREFPEPQAFIANQTMSNLNDGTLRYITFIQDDTFITVVTDLDAVSGDVAISVVEALVDGMPIDE